MELTNKNILNISNEKYVLLLGRIALEKNIKELNLEDIGYLNEVIYSLSYYYYVYKNTKALKVLGKIAMDIRVPMEFRIFIFWQLNNLYFLKGEKQVDLRKIYNSISKNSKKIIGNKFKSKIALKNTILESKESQSVVFITNQFLGYQHSPSKLLLNIIKTINKNFHEIKKIYIYNSVEKPFENYCAFHKSTIAHHVKFTDEEFEIYTKKLGINRCEVKYIDYSSNLDFFNRIKKMRDEICEINPKFIISIGGCNVLADLCDEISGVYTYGTTREMPIANTRYLVTSSKELDIVKNQVNKSQENIEIPFGFLDLECESEEVYTREDFLIPKEDFVLSVVGNRLDQEVTDDFLKFCDTILVKNNKLSMCFIGDCDNSRIKSKVSLAAYNKMYFLGFKNNLISAVAMSDLFLNPKRIGGGYGAMAAIINSVPILSCDLGDVAAYLSHEFKVENYEEMFLRVEEILRDKKLYENLKIKIEEIYNMYKKNPWIGLMKYILDEEK